MATQQLRPSLRLASFKDAPRSQPPAEGTDRQAFHLAPQPIHGGCNGKQQDHELVIGKQKGPTSASKRDPPGFKGILRGASPLAAAALVCSCSPIVVLLPFARRVKRSRALRGRNPTRDSSADGAPMGASLGPRPTLVAGGLLSSHPSDTRVHASENPGGLGAEPPRRHPASGLLLAGSLPFFLLFIDSRKR